MAELILESYAVHQRWRVSVVNAQWEAFNVVVYGLARDLVEHITRKTAADLADRSQGEVTIEAT